MKNIDSLIAERYVKIVLVTFPVSTHNLFVRLWQTSSNFR